MNVYLLVLGEVTPAQTEEVAQILRAVTGDTFIASKSSKDRQGRALYVAKGQDNDALREQIFSGAARLDLEDADTGLPITVRPIELLGLICTSEIYERKDGVVNALKRKHRRLKHHTFLAMKSGRVKKA